MHLNETQNENILTKHKRHSLWFKSIVASATVVVFCTTYALILPAITMEKAVANCGVEEEHEHNDICYKADGSLACDKREHLHTDECYATSQETTTVVVENTEGTQVVDTTNTQNTNNADSTSSTVENSKPADEQVATNSVVLLNEESSEESADVVINGVTYKDFDKYVKDRAEAFDTSGSTNEKLNRKTFTTAGVDPEDDDDGIYSYIYTSKSKAGIEPSDSEVVSNIADADFVYTYTKDGTDITEYRKLKSSYIHYLPDKTGMDISKYPTDDKLKGKITNHDSECIGEYRIDRDLKAMLLIFYPNAETKDNFEFEISFDVFFESLKAEVEKNGGFDSSNGSYKFTVEAKIPAHRKNGDYRQYTFSDYSYVDKSNKYVWSQDITNGTVTIKYGDGDSIAVPELKDVTDKDNVAYIVDDYNTVYLLNRCTCVDCDYENADSSKKVCTSLKDLFEYSDFKYDYTSDFDDWCACWCSYETAVITFNYSNDKYVQYKTGKEGNILDLVGKKYSNTITVDDGTDEVTDEVENIIPKFISKSNVIYPSGYDDDELGPNGEVEIKPNNGNLRDYIEKNSYQVPYRIIINENYADLSSLEDDIYIHDEMTEITYVPGSLKIMEEEEIIDEFGEKNYNQRWLILDIDYGVSSSYDGANTGEVGKTNILDVLIYKHLYADTDGENTFGKKAYYLYYDAMLNVTESVDGDMEFHNTAQVMIYNEPSDSRSSTFHFKVDSDFTTKSVTITKTDVGKMNLLGGAVYALYAGANDELMYNPLNDPTLADDEKVTNENGTFTYAFNMSKNIIYIEEKLYYLKEIKAPKGYSLSDEKAYFYFSTHQIPEFDALSDNVTWIEIDEKGKVLDETKANIDVVDELGFKLPNTGGVGSEVFMFAGAILMFSSSIIIYVKTKHKKIKK